MTRIPVTLVIIDTDTPVRLSDGMYVTGTKGTSLGLSSDLTYAPPAGFTAAFG